MAVGFTGYTHIPFNETSFLTTTRPNVFITGGQGHVGRTLIPTLVQHGYNVHSLARSLEARDRLRALGCTSVQAGDVLSQEAMKAAARGCTHFIHCASTFSHVDTTRTRYFHQMNLLVATHVVATCRQLGIRKLVLLSNCAVLCDGEQVVNAREDDIAVKSSNHHPLGACAKSMREVEMLVLRANDDANGLLTCVIRPRLLWGGYADPFTTHVIRAARTNRLRLVSGGDFRTSTCHVRNACEAIACALRHGKGGQVYFVTDGSSVQFVSFVGRILKAAGVENVDTLLNKSVSLFVARRVARVAEWVAQWCNSEAVLSEAGVCLMGQEMTVCDRKAREMLAYQNAITIEQGLEQLRATID